MAQGDADQGKSGLVARYLPGAEERPVGFVSVRASAHDGSGYSIKQEIIRAYGLR